ncbi:IclR family transcriptional regulator [Cellulosimicrobium cellulans]|uniref:IclR family transcriptional regulator n=1 Tax=Cellulosimicrobium cellulans TaxID=1710 RepID=UPI00130D8DB3|nr:IclR family transcriptional regulator [Cellulosimicrobium cellulans]
MEPSPPEPEDSRYWVRSVARAVDVLELLAARPPGEGMSVTEIGQALGLSKSAAFATLYTLTRRGLVADDGAGMSRRYRLGMALARLGSQALAQTSLRDVARPHLVALARTTAATARLATLVQDQAVVIDQVGGNERVRLDLRMGSHELPHSTGLGKAILSCLPPEQVRELVGRVGLLRRTSRTITDAGTLVAHLAESRAQGYAIDDEEDAEGVFCIGSPLLGHDGACVGAISITGLKLDQPSWHYQELGRTVRDAAGRISRDLGYDPDAPAVTTVGGPEVVDGPAPPG